MIEYDVYLFVLSTVGLTTEIPVLFIYLYLFALNENNIKLDQQNQDE